jgi:hypothetical protein
MKKGALMTQPVLATLYIHAGLAFLFAVGGVAALVFGFIVFWSRRGDALPQIAFELGRAKIFAHSTGPVVMATAVVWAVIAAWASPTLKVSPAGAEVANSSVVRAEVYSFPTQNGRVNVPAVVAPANPASQAPADLASALKAHLDTDLIATATISGKPAHVAQVHPVMSTGKTVLLTEFESSDAVALVKYEVRVSSKGGKPELVFEPLSATAAAPKPKG